MCVASISWKLLLLVLLTIVKTRADSTACEQKEKHLALLDLAKDSISIAKDLQPDCGNDSKDISTNSSECGANGKIAANLDIAKNLIEAAKENYTACDVGKIVTKVVILHRKPADCSEIMENGHNESGIYTIWPKQRIFNGESLEVFCDMDTDGGGWTLIQRRGQFKEDAYKKEDFFRDWNDYKIGFGNLSEEFWIGNDKIFALTNQGNYTLRFDLENIEYKRTFANYSSFWIEDEDAGYRLHYGYYSGNAGDRMTLSKDMQFSTKDKLSAESNKECPKKRYSAWWFSDCSDCNPNGWNEPGVKYYERSMYWLDWAGWDSTLTIEMKIRAEK